MKKILVSLVSAQTLPNIEFIREMKNETDAYLFISTPGMEKQGRRDWIVKTADIPISRLMDTIIVNEFSFEDIERKLIDQIIDDSKISYLVNLTGGTKIMSLAVYEFFKSLGADIYYLPGNGEKIKIHPGRKKVATDILAKISLQDYLNAYGFTITKTGAPIRSFEDSERVLHYFLHHYSRDEDSPVLGLLQKHRKTGIKNIEEHPYLEDFLKNVEFVPKNYGVLDKYECQYLSGEWL